ncbi:MAG: hypothetical protein FWF56_05060 [Firmicutes bacterium]|nr:hypothetical protein [Bacillota bacterium]MCL1954223.1 hypothetical protein [Bacillota bacterium]
MIKLKDFTVYTRNKEYFFGTESIHSKSKLDKFVDSYSKNFYTYLDGFPNASKFIDCLLNYNASYFDNKFLILHGALKEYTIGYRYGINDYSFDNGNLNIKVDILEKGTSRSISYSILLFEVDVSCNTVESTTISVLDKLKD